MSNRFRRLLQLVLFASLFVSVLGCTRSSDTDFDNNDYEEQNEEKEPKDLITENLVVITLDGVRWQEVFLGADPYFFPENIGYIKGDYEEVKEKYWANTDQERREKLMPFFWTELVDKGKIYGNRKYDNKVKVTNSSLKSFPGYCEIWNGYADPNITGNKPTINNNLTVLEYISRQEGFEGDNIAIRAAGAGLDDLFHANDNDFIISAGHKDSTVFNKIMRDLENHRPRIAYAAFNDTDHYAHAYEYDTYLDLINQADSFIRDIWNYIQQNQFYRNKTTLIITTDHGRGIEREWHTHGSGGVEHADETWFAVVGPDTEATGEQKDEVEIEATQFAQTMAALLGLTFESNNKTGDVIESVLDK